MCVPASNVSTSTAGLTSGYSGTGKDTPAAKKAWHCRGVIELRHGKHGRPASHGGAALSPAPYELGLLDCPPVLRKL